ncbi:hypothetical protein AB4Y64_08765 [Lysobacter sp. TAF61]|uniref:hypothetical protein n=1 Tax=Lysobacter sp. TAF61 TaxID=3233072 RepID=UPI003F946AA7
MVTRTARKTPVAKPAPTPRKRAAKPRITPEQALANTQELLAAKHERDHQPQPWQQFDPGHGHVPKPGFQSDSAAAKAGELHAAESRMEATQGSIGTQDRHNQGKRDSR